MSDPVELTEAEGLFNILFGHQRIPTYDGTAGQRCTGCDSLKGETDGPNSPRQAKHLAALILEAGWVSPEEHAAAIDDLHEGVDQVNRVSALAADLQWRGDTEGARLIFAALNGERA